MSYSSLYRKWRPRTFAEIAGQAVASKLLTSALRSGSINHAYLFCGPRGVGKTTTARIFSRAVNCVRGVTSEPCGECPSCRRIQDGTSLDVIEIDAASHRGIDDIRELREKIKYSPLESRYKVYIIDEVHMLTPEAFNALLKTLEEPPAHAIFILATTAPQRLPETILSRCLRINFTTIDSRTTITQLQKIAQQEGYDVETEALALVARKAEGSLRDAESLLEQLMAWGEKHITCSETVKILREVDEEDLDHLFSLMKKDRQGESILLVNQWLYNGLGPEDILRAFASYLRTLLILQLAGPQAVDGITPQRSSRLLLLIKDFPVMPLRKALQRLQNMETEIRRSFQPQILLELALLDIIDLLMVSRSQHQMSPAIEKVELPLSPPITTPTTVLPETEGVAEPGEENRGPDTSWPKILQEVKKKKISLYAFLQSAEFRLDEDSQAVLVFGPECAFHKESVERRENTELLKDIIEGVQGRRCRLECVLKKSSTAVPALSDFGEAVVSGSTVAGNGPREKKVENSFQEFSSNGKNPLVEVTELFSGLVVEYSSTEEHIKGGWEESDFEKSDEGSPENAGQDGQNPGGIEK